jgi:hypothetical protein
MLTPYGTYPEPLELVHDYENRKLLVRNRFYEVEHDLSRGGAIAAIRYGQIGDRNILVEPMGSFVELSDATRAWPTPSSLAFPPPSPHTAFTDLNDAQPEVHTGGNGDELRLRFGGWLCNPEGRSCGVRYEFEYRYRWGHIRVHKQFLFPQSGLDVLRLCVQRFVLRPEFSHWGYRPSPETDTRSDPFWGHALGQWGRARPGTHYDNALETRFIPCYVANAEAGRQGLEWFSSDLLSEWSYQITGRAGTGWFRIAPRADIDGVEVEISPLCLPRGSFQVKRALDFHFYHGFPILSGRAPQPFLHRAFNRRHWPTDDEVGGWAHTGIRNVHFHHDGDGGNDGLFWRDGSYPPFPPSDMAEYDRVIAACKRHRIGVITYVSNKELYPTTEAFLQHGDEWARKADDRARVIHNYWRNFEFGGQMCLRSGWLDFQKQYIETILSHHALDGIYFDWNQALYCHNPAHLPSVPGSPNGSDMLGTYALSPVGHWDIDELLEITEWTRRRVGPEGLVIVHNSMFPCAATEDFADHVVSMEWGYGQLSKGTPRPDELPLEWNFMGARSRGVISGNGLIAGAPALLEDMVNLLCMVTGTTPWPAREGALRLYSSLKGLDGARYRFYDWRNTIVRLDHPAMASAVYATDGEAIALIANLSANTERAICRVNAENGGLARTASVRSSDAGLWPANEPFPIELKGCELRVLRIA